MIYCIENVFTVYSTDRVLVSKLIYLLGLVNIFKSVPEWGHMRDFIFTKCCGKGFVSEIRMLDDKWLLKMA